MRSKTLTIFLGSLPQDLNKHLKTRLAGENGNAFCQQLLNSRIAAVESIAESDGVGMTSSGNLCRLSAVIDDMQISLAGLGLDIAPGRVNQLGLAPTWMG